MFITAVCVIFLIKIAPLVNYRESSPSLMQYKIIRVLHTVIYTSKITIIFLETWIIASWQLFVLILLAKHKHSERLQINRL